VTVRGFVWNNTLAYGGTFTVVHKLLERRIFVRHANRLEIGWLLKIFIYSPLVYSLRTSGYLSAFYHR